MNEPWTGSAYVGNFIVCDTANSESSVTVNGGWYGDAQSGYYIVFQGWSLDLIGTDFTNYTSIIQLSGPTGSVCITGGYFKSGASPYAVLDANSQTVNTVSITGAAFLDHHHPAHHNSSGVRPSPSTPVPGQLTSRTSRRRRFRFPVTAERT